VLAGSPSPSQSAAPSSSAAVTASPGAVLQLQVLPANSSVELLDARQRTVQLRVYSTAAFFVQLQDASLRSWVQLDVPPSAAVAASAPFRGLAVGVLFNGAAAPSGTFQVTVVVTSVGPRGESNTALAHINVRSFAPSLRVAPASISSLVAVHRVHLSTVAVTNVGQRPAAVSASTVAWTGAPAGIAQHTGVVDMRAWYEQFVEKFVQDHPGQAVPAMGSARSRQVLPGETLFLPLRLNSSGLVVGAYASQLQIGTGDGGHPALVSWAAYIGTAVLDIAEADVVVESGATGTASLSLRADAGRHITGVAWALEHPAAAMPAGRLLTETSASQAHISLAHSLHARPLVDVVAGEEPCLPRGLQVPVSPSELASDDAVSDTIAVEAAIEEMASATALSAGSVAPLPLWAIPFTALSGPLLPTAQWAQPLTLPAQFPAAQVALPLAMHTHGLAPGKHSTALLLRVTTLCLQGGCQPHNETFVVPVTVRVTRGAAKQSNSLWHSSSDLASVQAGQPFTLSAHLLGADGFAARKPDAGDLDTKVQYWNGGAGGQAADASELPQHAYSVQMASAPSETEVNASVWQVHVTVSPPSPGLLQVQVSVTARHRGLTSMFVLGADGVLLSEAPAGFISVRAADCSARTGQVATAAGGCQCSPGWEPAADTTALTPLQCVSCPAGQYSNGTACARCPSGQFSYAAAAACMACPAVGVSCASGGARVLGGFFAPQGENVLNLTPASSLTACRSPENCVELQALVDELRELQSLQGHAAATTNMSVRALQSRDDQQRRILQLRIALGDADQSSTFQGQPVAALDKCAPGHEGTLCAECSVGYAQAGASCAECWSPAASGLFTGLSMVFFVLFILFQVALTVAYQPQRADAAVMLRTGLSWLHFYGALASFNLSLPQGTSSTGLLQIAGGIADGLSLSLFPMQCSLQLTYYQRFYGTLLTPLILACIMLGIGAFFTPASEPGAPAGGCFGLCSCGKGPARIVGNPLQRTTAQPREVAPMVEMSALNPYSKKRASVTKQAVLSQLDAEDEADLGSERQDSVAQLPGGGRHTRTAAGAGTGSAAFPQPTRSRRSTSVTADFSAWLRGEHRASVVAQRRLRGMDENDVSATGDLVSPWDVAVGATVSMLWYLYPAVTKATMTVFDIYPSTVGGREWLAADMAVPLDTPQFTLAQTVGSIVFIIFVAGMPLASMLWLVLSKLQLHTPRMRARASVLFDGYHLHGYYFLWDGVKAATKAIMVFVAVMVGNTQLQLSLGTALVLFALLLHIVASPITRSGTNAFETAALGVTAVTLLGLGMLDSGVDSEQWYQNTSSRWRDAVREASGSPWEGLGVQLTLLDETLPAYRAVIITATLVAVNLVLLLSFVVGTLSLLFPSVAFGVGLAGHQWNKCTRGCESWAHGCIACMLPARREANPEQGQSLDEIAGRARSGSRAGPRKGARPAGAASEGAREAFSTVESRTVRKSVASMFSTLGGATAAPAGKRPLAEPPNVNRKTSFSRLSSGAQEQVNVQALFAAVSPNSGFDLIGRDGDFVSFTPARGGKNGPPPQRGGGAGASKDFLDGDDELASEAKATQRELAQLYREGASEDDEQDGEGGGHAEQNGGVRAVGRGSGFKSDLSSFKSSRRMQGTLSGRALVDDGPTRRPSVIAGPEDVSFAFASTSVKNPLRAQDRRGSDAIPMSTNKIPPPSKERPPPGRNGPPPVGASRRLPPAVGQARQYTGAATGPVRAMPPALGQARRSAAAAELEADSAGSSEQDDAHWPSADGKYEGEDGEEYAASAEEELAYVEGGVEEEEEEGHWDQEEGAEGEAGAWGEQEWDGEADDILHAVYDGSGADEAEIEAYE